MHEVAGSSPVESTKHPASALPLRGVFLLRFFGRARGWEPLCVSKAFSPRSAYFTLSSGENKRLIIVWRGAPLKARALSNPPEHPASALPLRGVFLLRAIIVLFHIKTPHKKPLPFVRRRITFYFTANGFYLTPPPPPPCPPPEKPPKCPPLPPPPRKVPPLGCGRDIADTNDARSMELSST